MDEKPYTYSVIKWDHRAGELWVLRKGIVLFGHRTRIRGAGTDAKEIPENLSRSAKERRTAI